MDTLNKLTITKTANPTLYSAVGEIINYSYTITNEGTSTLTPPFAVTDDKVTPTCNVPATLAPTESFICTASVSITQADLDAGSITNIASATSKDADLDTVTSNTASETVTATQAPGLRLDKSVTSGGPYSDVGDPVNYSYILTNTGNVTLSSPFVVSDDKVMVGCPSSTSLAPNDILTCTATYTVMQNDIDIGNVTNTATATAQFGAAIVTSNADSETVNANQNTGLTLVKSITSGNPYMSSGDVIQYSYLLTNTGNVTLQGNGAGNQFTVTDDKAMVTCPATPTTLAPNGTVTCTASYTVTSGDLGGSVINQATAHALFGSTPVDSNQDSQVAYGSPVLEVTKDDGLSIVAPNASIQYTVTMRNNSLQDASGLQIVDSLPAGTKFGSASNGGVYDSSTGQITWPAFDLAAGDSIRFTVRVQVQDTMQLQAGSITSITNQVTVQDDGSHSNGIPVQANASDTDQITIKGVKSLAGTEQPGSLTPKVLIGEILDYSINIDIPTGTIARLQAVDSLDHGLAFVGCDLMTPIASGTLVIDRNPCTEPTALTVQAEPITDTNPASEEAGRHITFDFGQVENAGNFAQTLTLNYRVIVLDVDDNVQGLKHLNNRVEWIWSGGMLSGEAQSVEITEPELIIEKTVDPTVAALGNIVTYIIKVEHAASSSAPAYDVIVTDKIPIGLALDPSSIIVTGSTGLTTPVMTSTSNSFTVTWASFPLGEQATVQFKARFVGPAPVVNRASVEWSSLLIDPASRFQPKSPHNQYSTERRYDPLDPAINDYRVEASATLNVPHAPSTGFAPNQVTQLSAQPKDKAYQDLGSLWLEIPRLGVKVSIVGVPLDSQNEWDLAWLGSQAGYLNSTAYPTHKGNSVLTGHAYLPSGLPGPFVNLQALRYGDEIIVHLSNQRYVYQVRENKWVSPKDASLFKHQDYPWLTLVTCRNYDEMTKSYLYRVAVGAILVRIESE